MEQKNRLLSSLLFSVVLDLNHNKNVKDYQACSILSSIFNTWKSKQLTTYWNSKIGLLEHDLFQQISIKSTILLQSLDDVFAWLTLP